MAEKKKKAGKGKMRRGKRASDVAKSDPGRASGGTSRVKAKPSMAKRKVKKKVKTSVSMVEAMTPKRKYKKKKK
tara:strand:+ start:159 stop:380 length:222 start_codon:yes stop_codon:yes gene_type:complete